MARKVRVKCSECDEVIEVTTDQLLIDLVDDHHVLMFTCDECDAFVTKLLSEKNRDLLTENGVMTVDEMSHWIVEELEKEK